MREAQEAVPRPPPGQRVGGEWIEVVIPVTNGLLFGGFGLGGLTAALRPQGGPEPFLLGVSGALLLLSLAAMAQARRAWRDTAITAAVRDHGEELEAEVLEATPTGMRINKRRVVALRLRIQPAGAAPCEVAVRCTVPGRRDGAVDPGERLPARVHPAYPDRVVLTAQPQALIVPETEQ
ncbi:MAG: hypothetical protein H6739_31400 [Alphaproteobacteria bacterium]|nr:hypothetical protein [Alphaproteobacteria bacterium]